MKDEIMKDSINTESTTKNTNKSTKRKKLEFDIITNTFRNKFQQQINHDSATKEKVLEYAINAKVGGAYTQDVFNQDAAKRINNLLKNAEFHEIMKQYGVDPFAGATHFILLGTQTVNDFLEGKPDSQPQVYEEWKKPLFNKEVMISCQPQIKHWLDDVFNV